MRGRVFWTLVVVFVLWLLATPVLTAALSLLGPAPPTAVVLVARFPQWPLWLWLTVFGHLYTRGSYDSYAGIVLCAMLNAGIITWLLSLRPRLRRVAR